MKKQVYIFGAGNNGQKLLAYLKEVENQEVAAFIDNYIQNVEIDGIECISIDEAIKRGAQNEMVFVSPEKSEDIENQLEKEGFQWIFCSSEWMRKKDYPVNIYYKPKILQEMDYCKAKPFNHYESPYSDITKIHENEHILFDREKEVLDIDFNLERQMELIEKMKQFHLPDWNEIPFGGYRYFYKNHWFGKGSADALYYMIRIVQPKKIIEVGSGYSTAVMLDTNEFYFDNKLKIISIEPRTERLRAILKSTDNIQIYEKNFQEMPMSVFEKLEENDILFIDSSHVSKMDSDVNFLFFEILPRLKSGVYIHFHDVFYPFIYPKEWIHEGRAYNEMYILRAFLMNNAQYKIQLFGHMLEYQCMDKIPKHLKGCGSGSLWIKKIK